MNKARNRNLLRRQAQPRRWSRLSRLEHLEARQLLAGDVATTEFASIRLEATDLSGVPITEVQSGESFLIKAYFQDRRGQPGVDVSQIPEALADPWGLFAAYMNITYDKDGFDFDPSYTITAGPQVDPVEPIQSDPLDPDPIPLVDDDGYIGRIGLADVVSGFLQPQEIELFSFRMIAEQPGDYSGEEAIRPWYHFHVPERIYDPNVPEPEREIRYVDGVPQLVPLTGAARDAAIEEADEYISLSNFGGQFLTEEGQVFFQGINLVVTAASPPEPEFDFRFVKNTTNPFNGEVSNLPSNLSYIDEWETFYVEVYAKAPEGSNTAITSANVQLSFTAGDFEFVEAIGTADDPAVRYSVSYTDDQSENGNVTVGFTTLATNVGDDNYALVGRILLRSLMEVENDTSDGYIQSIPSSVITLSDANATLRHKTEATQVIVDGDTPAAGYSFDVWPVMYDTDDNEDRKVGLSDFSGFVSAFGLAADTPKGRKYDFDKNGVVGLSDFNLFVQNFGQNGNSLEGRIYNNQFPSGYQSAPLMGSMSLEGEPVDESSPGVIYQSGPPQPLTDASSSDLLQHGRFAYQPVSPAGAQAEQGGNEELTAADPTASPLVSTDTLWTDQSDLIWQAASESGESLADDDSDEAFPEYADEVHALWANEDNL